MKAADCSEIRFCINTGRVVSSRLSTPLAVSENACIRVFALQRTPAEMASQGSGPGTNAAAIPALQPKPRRILGNVSPNVRTMAVSKPQESSSGDFSLKRSLSSTLDNDSGFTYLKKRKLLSDRDLTITRRPSQENFQAPNITAQATPVPGRVQVCYGNSHVFDRMLTIPRQVASPSLLC